MLKKSQEFIKVSSELLSDIVPIILALGGITLGIIMLITGKTSPEVSTIASSAIAGSAGLARIDKKDGGN